MPDEYARAVREEPGHEPGPACEEQEGAIMPNEENKSGEQKVAEAEVEALSERPWPVRRRR